MTKHSVDELMGTFKPLPVVKYPGKKVKDKAWWSTPLLSGLRGRDRSIPWQPDLHNEFNTKQNKKPKPPRALRGERVYFGSQLHNTVPFLLLGSFSDRKLEIPGQLHLQSRSRKNGGTHALLFFLSPPILSEAQPGNGTTIN